MARPSRFRLPVSPWVVYGLGLVAAGGLAWAFPFLWEVALAWLFGGLYWVVATRVSDRQDERR